MRKGAEVQGRGTRSLPRQPSRQPRTHKQDGRQAARRGGGAGRGRHTVLGSRDAIVGAPGGAEAKQQDGGAGAQGRQAAPDAVDAACGWEGGTSGQQRPSALHTPSFPQQPAFRRSVQPARLPPLNAPDLQALAVGPDEGGRAKVAVSAAARRRGTFPRPQLGATAALSRSSRGGGRVVHHAEGVASLLTLEGVPACMHERRGQERCERCATVTVATGRA